MDDLTLRYIERINKSLASDGPNLETKQYSAFKEQYLPRKLSIYERACNLSERILKVSPNASERPKLEEALRICHLNATPEGVASFAIVGPLALALATALVFFIMPILVTSIVDPASSSDAGSMFILVFGIIAAISLIIPLQRLPYFFANSWRMQASNQMVLCTFYIVTYMRHTSNLELAIDFAGEHLSPPLAIDMKKVLWDIETQKYESLKESLDAYLNTWREWNPEFIESMHLIEGSLLETSESRRIEMLDKSLSVMLEETYEKMLHYAHNLKSPLTTLHMLGVILPILGLVILPLVVNFIPEARWYWMAVMYNIALPALVYLVAKQILSTRPTGYGGGDVTAMNPELQKYRDIIIPFGGKDELRLSPTLLSVVIIAGLMLVAALPFLYHIASPNTDWVYDDANGLHQVNPANQEEVENAKFFFLDYRLQDGQLPYDEIDNPLNNGPFGIGAVLFSLFVPLALGIGLGIYFSIRSSKIMKIREETRKLELEFASALFQLGNRLADGLPAEIAFEKVSDVLQGTPTADFFDTVTVNITKLGMSVEEAIFDPKQGALLNYPSNIIESSMKVLVESSRKGPLVASQAVINVSEYIKQMHRVDERLKDLLSEVISSMKSQINFLTPVIAGIVIGITTMISSILGTIGTRLTALQSTVQSGTAGLQIFGGSGIPIYHFQAIVGLYVVQITIILTIMVNGVENGVDDAAKQYGLGKNLIRATALYVAISAITIILFGFIAGNIARI